MEAGKLPGEVGFRVLPDTCAELFISCDASPLASVNNSRTNGTYSSFANFRMRNYADVQMFPESRFISVCFYPGAACRFFPVNMLEVSDTSVDINLIWGSTSADLQDKVANAPADETKISIVQDFLLRQLQQDRNTGGQLKYILNRIDRMKGQVSVKELATDFGTSERQLNRHFIRQVGISPKEFTTMNRFIHALNHLKTYPSDNLTEIAYHSGYYDQAHFIHECRAFSGLTPKELRYNSGIIY